MRAMATPSLSLPDYDSTPRLGTVGAIVKRRAGNRRIDHHGVSSRGIRPAFSGLSFVPWGTCSEYIAKPSVEMLGYFQTRPGTQAKRPRARPSFLCRTRSNKHTWRDRVVSRGDHAKKSFGSPKSPCTFSVVARRGAVRSGGTAADSVRFEPVPRKKLDVLLNRPCAMPLGRPGGFGGVPQVCLLRLMSVAPKSN